MRDAIIEIAARLFVENGFQETRIDAIAEEADVAVGTVYNHFTTKSDILVAILLADLGSVVAKTRSLVAEPGSDTVQAMLGIGRAVIDTMEQRPRSLWRQLFAHSLLDAAGLGMTLLAVNRQYIALLRTLLEHLRANGDLAERFVLTDITAVTFSIGNSLVYDYIRDDSMTADDFQAALGRQLAALF